MQGHTEDTSRLVTAETSLNLRKRVQRWQRCHVILFMSAFLTSLAGILAFGLLVKNFSVFCPLSAKVVVERVKNGTQYDFTRGSQWGAKAACDYCLFTTVTSFVYAFLWLWIFCSCSAPKAESASNSYAPWRVVPPAIVVTCLFSILMLSCAVILTVGSSTFCSTLQQQLHLESCSDAQSMRWSTKYVKMENFYNLITRSEIAIWLATTCWILNSALLCLRCVCLQPDFPKPPA
ncbi:transmembrane protein 179B-like [Ornithodoros turicata]|uniref:transmembrane protein 179B-like n=1 Tax=Ornithodoros turicata TaxID=34597 RepID=UPI0031390BE1